jgi:hypothetical protein
MTANAGLGTLLRQVCSRLIRRLGELPEDGGQSAGKFQRERFIPAKHIERYRN